jgi:uncharacterized protein
MAKLLLILLLVVLVGCWIARARAPHAPRGQRRRGAAPARPEQIVACAHCGLHLPRAEAVRGAAGYYCSEAHRLAHDDRA